jgi:hypothetical protein
VHSGLPGLARQISWASEMAASTSRYIILNTKNDDVDDDDDIVVVLVVVRAKDDDDASTGTDVPAGGIAKASTEEPWDHHARARRIHRKDIIIIIFSCSTGWLGPCLCIVSMYKLVWRR